MRGKLTQSKAIVFGRGITPAGAGKTVRVIKSGTLTRDHPRRCGENALRSIHLPKRLGSPPQVRGKRCSIFYHALNGRITPAGAGKTFWNGFRSMYYEDHPRRCGENDTIISWTAKEIGSPPQVRGKQCGQSLLRCTPGITPAGAGKTKGYTDSLPTKKDHPRRCGENPHT